MCSDATVVSVASVSKCYRIYDTPRDRLKDFVMPRIQRLCGRQPKAYGRDFLALQDVSFDLRRGETVGIIGRNGSGKSTLLQIICGTLSPTAGTVETRGRVAALLELGAGFNPEFSGRENVFMNAAVLGLTEAQINERFEAIEAFADIGDYIDQPVKTYSSGMYVRLAFAIIAHVDADILVVDEALAVGDAVFTQKCMRFIRAFQERGTLLFVSHDMSSVQNLCRRAIWLSNGRIEQSGTSKEVAEAYLQYTLQEIYGNEASLKIAGAGGADPVPVVEPAGDPVPLVDYSSQVAATDNLQTARGWSSGGAEISAVTMENAQTGATAAFAGGERVRVRIRARANQDLASPILGFLVRDRLGQDLFGENTLPFTASSPRSVKGGQEFCAEFVFRLPMLPNGQYAVMASVADGDLYNNIQHHYLHDALVINVASSRVRWGLVGIPFERITLEAING